MGFRLQSPISQEGSYIKSPVMKFLGIFVLLVVLTFGVVNAQDAKGSKGLTGLTAKEIVERPELLNAKNARKFVADPPKEVKKLMKLKAKMEETIRKEMSKTPTRKTYHKMKKLMILKLCLEPKKDLFGYCK